jgi:hypothetical protein
LGNLRKSSSRRSLLLPRKKKGDSQPTGKSPLKFGISPLSLQRKFSRKQLRKIDQLSSYNIKDHRMRASVSPHPGHPPIDPHRTNRPGYLLRCFLQVFFPGR